MQICTSKNVEGKGNTGLCSLVELDLFEGLEDTNFQCTWINTIKSKLVLLHGPVKALELVILHGSPGRTFPMSRLQWPLLVMAVSMIIIGPTLLAIVWVDKRFAYMIC